jgi:hypothetical protein
MNEFVFDRLNICGCGDGDGQVEFIKKYLNYMTSFDYMNPRVIELIVNNPEPIFEILNHFLAREGLITYGTSVRGAWFDATQENEEFLARLNNLRGT